MAGSTLSILQHSRPYIGHFEKHVQLMSPMKTFLFRYIHVDIYVFYTYGTLPEHCLHFSVLSPQLSVLRYVLIQQVIVKTHKVK